jgi:hypothetical protein
MQEKANTPVFWRKIYEKTTRLIAECTKMRLKSWEEKYCIHANIEETQMRVQKALDELGLRNVTVKKHVPPRYLLVEYSPSWVGKAFEIEFLFKETEMGTTELAVKWPYMKEFPHKDEPPSAFYQHQEETKRKTEQLIEEFKRKIGATAMASS